MRGELGPTPPAGQIHPAVLIISLVKSDGTGSSVNPGL